ncbi:methyl-accepting chemotaxis protein [Vibrio diazotrophicus]|jgi:methyl-accepting chemotaxis protein|uniref:Methyl-accepting chemotaxis protein n=1 Tax=Vibrio diazotrophicus TaxID=685 RepID=A0ABX4W4L6_VIBDI|nr:methyl-accepting chemotaxis protein [Vibrio diazotrophicus]PNH84844.1 methyl-accepting chemotaxis protein [Vibrio diazotrophicus]PNH96506.1 methyl-accepting chemotaxis protein [Vibrio diazotrophicus]
MKVVTQVIIAFVSVIVMFSVTNAFTVYRSTSAKANLAEIIQSSLSLNEMANNLQHQSQSIDLQLNDILVLDKIDTVDIAKVDLQNSYEHLVQSVSSAHFFEDYTQKQLIELIGSWRQISNQLVESKKEIISLDQKIIRDRKELENIAASSDIIFKRVVDKRTDIDEFLRKDIEAYLEKRNAAIALSNRILFSRDLEDAISTQKQIKYLESIIAEEEDYLLDELVDLNNDRDYQKISEQLKEYLFSTSGVSATQINLLNKIKYVQDLKEQYSNYKSGFADHLKQIVSVVRDNNQKLKSNVTTVLDTIVSFQLVTLVVCVVFVLFAGSILTHKIKKPIGYVLSVLERMVNGDYTQRVNTAGWSEEFTYLTKQLEKVIKTNSSLINQVKNNNSELKEQSQDNSQAIGNVCETGNDQMLSMHSISAAAEQLENISKDTQSAVTKVMGHTHLIQEFVETTLISVDAMVTGNEELNQRIAESSKTISDVENRTSDISQIITVIDEIANQTNLLALNAAIEAARAGEHGRGFSVVSDEVSNLAKQTTHSTHKIQKMIDNLNRASATAVQGMSSCSTQMEQNTLHLQQVKTVINQINEHISDLVVETDVITRSSTEQFQSCSHIATAVADVVSGLEVSISALENVNERSSHLLSLSKQQHRELDKFNT